MRLFVGVELGDRLRAACAAAARQLSERLRDRRAALQIRWVPEASLHVTLAFLGEVDDRRAAAIVEGLRPAFAAAGGPFTVAGSGVFPPSGPPRIVWLGIGDGAARLREVHGELAGRLEVLGFPPEPRPFHPHVTIGRVKDGSGSRGRLARALLTGADVTPGGGELRHITLFRSRLSPGGSEYEAVQRVPLREC
jgi:RNA 2',3'-cyclic 3'-phosphodiesterase